jgi:hypothetical protein
MKFQAASLVELHAFLAARRTGSMRRAAEQLCVTQAAVSRAVARLERLGHAVVDAAAEPVQAQHAGIDIELRRSRRDEDLRRDDVDVWIEIKRPERPWPRRAAPRATSKRRQLRAPGDLQLQHLPWRTHAGDRSHRLTAAHPQLHRPGIDHAPPVGLHHAHRLGVHVEAEPA